MNAVWTLAGLTIKEAIRRRVFIASLFVALIFVLFAVIPFHFGRGVEGLDLQAIQERNAKILAWLGCGVIKFFASVIAVTLAAGAITAEVDRGVLSIVAPKPLPRASIYLGKWIGLLTLLAASVLIWSLILVSAIYIQTHVFFPRVFVGILATFLFPILFATLTLFFSSFATHALSAGLALIAAGIALAEDMLTGLALILNAPVLKTISQIVGYIVPLGKMNHWITRGLGNAGLDVSAMSSFGQKAVETSTADMVYILFYIAAALAAGLFIFQKRDL
ncbi:MAG: ABC transporter permease subunit [Capsulimonas sp.]|jgi:ABC-type transport system involved in multi-copper enzyme maturation permease subunit|uniref:ABC transporter permease n=1 Tax=Capsulimonas sp. TaxID=2494211 RepID=UPI0032672DDF|nr:ABC-type transport system involved in multi-copper enzyme maturation, permease component [Capsulimonas sp.]